MLHAESGSVLCLPMTGAYYCDVIMGAMASLITSLTSVYSTVHSGTDQRKHQSSASLALVWGLHRRPVNSMNKWQVTWKNVSIDDVFMGTAFSHGQTRHSPCKCKLSFTIYMAYDMWYHQCCVHKLWSMLCLPVAGACTETASSHGQTRHSTCTCKLSFTIYMAYGRWYHPCCVPGVGQYCACRCLMQKLYSAMGRHLYHLCCIRGVWSMLCLLLVWCPMAFNHQQTWYGNYILYAESYHVLNV